METLEKNHAPEMKGEHLIKCQNCGKLAAEIYISYPFYKQEPQEEPAPPKADGINVAALDAAIHEATVKIEKTKKMSQLEQQILALLFMEPKLTGKEIVERTGGKQSTVYSILRRIKNATSEVIAPKEQPPSPKLTVVPKTVEEFDLVDYLELLNEHGGRWGETQA